MNELNRTKHKSVLLVIEHPISLKFAYTSRVYHLSKVLNKFGVSTVIIPQRKDLKKFLRGESRIQKYVRRAYLFWRMTCIVKQRKVKYIFARGFYLGLMSIFLAKVFGLKAIFDFHGYIYQEEIYRGLKYKPFFTSFLEKLCIKYTDLIITQTESNRHVIGDLNKNVVVVENGIDPLEFTDLEPQKSILNKYSIPDSKPIVGFIGNWEKWMNIEDLLNSSYYLSDALIVIIGEGRNFTKYKNEYKNVFFTGRISHFDAMSLLINFDVCVSPHSKDEIMKYKSARKTFEYMAAGKSIIVSNVVGKEYFLDEGINCLTYEPGNPKDLAEKIRILLEDPELRTKMGINNRRLAENFTWDKNLERSGLVEILRMFKWKLRLR